MKIKSLLPTAAERRDGDHYNGQFSHQQHQRADGAYSKGFVASTLVSDDDVGDSYDDSRAELVAMNHNLVSNETKNGRVDFCLYSHTMSLICCVDVGSHEPSRIHAGKPDGRVFNQTDAVTAVFVGYGFIDDDDVNIFT